MLEMFDYFKENLMNLELRKMNWNDLREGINYILTKIDGLDLKEHFL
jgi:hypothetical protein